MFSDNYYVKDIFTIKLKHLSLVKNKFETHTKDEDISLNKYLRSNNNTFDIKTLVYCYFVTSQALFYALNILL